MGSLHKKNWFKIVWVIETRRRVTQPLWVIYLSISFYELTISRVIYESYILYHKKLIKMSWTLTCGYANATTSETISPHYVDIVTQSNANFFCVLRNTKNWHLQLTYCAKKCFAVHLLIEFPIFNLDYINCT